MNDPSRRHVLVGGSGLLAALAAGGPVPAGAAGPPIYIADMHYHLFFVGRRPAGTQPLGPNMAKGRATLVAWTVVGDQPWLTPAVGTFKQSGKPSSGQPIAWLDAEIGRVRAHLSGQGLAIVRTPDDVARAVAGKPHVVLAVEGATFADDGVEQVKRAYDLGVRHMQLVHFIANRIGDVQTEAVTHGGLTAHGRQVVEACNRLGILIDLAHATERVVDDVLDMSKAPVVWSHSSLQGWRGALPFAPAFAKRQLAQRSAKRIADKGGVVGLWALGADVGTTVESYADRVLALADQLGEQHVGFGTDMNALSNPALKTFTDLSAVVDLLLKRGRSDAFVRAVAIGNYARVLTTAMKPA